MALTNGDFESGSTGWTLSTPNWSGIAIGTYTAHSGTKTAYLYGSCANGNALSELQQFSQSCDFGGNGKVKFWIRKNANTNNGGTTVRIEVLVDGVIKATLDNTYLVNLGSGYELVNLDLGGALTGTHLLGIRTVWSQPTNGYTSYGYMVDDVALNNDAAPSLSETVLYIKTNEQNIVSKSIQGSYIVWPVKVVYRTGQTIQATFREYAIDNISGDLVGGGGGGACGNGAINGSIGGYGGGGAYAGAHTVVAKRAVTPGSNIVITVGAGGHGMQNSEDSAGAGGATSIVLADNTTLQAAGGSLGYSNGGSFSGCNGGAGGAGQAGWSGYGSGGMGGQGQRCTGGSNIAGADGQAGAVVLYLYPALMVPVTKALQGVYTVLFTVTKALTAKYAINTMRALAGKYQVFPVVKVYATGGDFQCIVPEGCTGMDAIAIGAGGGGGGGSGANTLVGTPESPADNSSPGGAGGGSGYAAYRYGMNVIPGQFINVHVGNGGMAGPRGTQAGQSGQSGTGGDLSAISIPGYPTLSAQGGDSGEGGQLASMHAQGGQHDHPGGDGYVHIAGACGAAHYYGAQGFGAGGRGGRGVEYIGGGLASDSTNGLGGSPGGAILIFYGPGPVQKTFAGKYSVVLLKQLAGKYTIQLQPTTKSLISKSTIIIASRKVSVFQVLASAKISASWINVQYGVSKYLAGDFDILQSQTTRGKYSIILIPTPNTLQALYDVLIGDMLIGKFTIASRTTENVDLAGIKRGPLAITEVTPITPVLVNMAGIKRGPLLSPLTSLGALVNLAGIKRGPIDVTFEFRTNVEELYPIKTVTVNTGITDQTATVEYELDGEYALPRDQQVSVMMKDHLGRDQCIFVGILPSEEGSYDDADNTTTFRGYDMAYYLTKQYVPYYELVAQEDEKPTVTVYNKLGASWWIHNTGIEPYKIGDPHYPPWTSNPSNPSNWYIKKKLFKWAPKTSKMTSIRDEEDYWAYVFNVAPREWYPGYWGCSAWFVPQDLIDDSIYGLDLPAPVVIRNPDVYTGEPEYLLGPVTRSRMGDERYNKIIVQGFDVDGILHRYIKEDPSVTSGEVKPLEYLEEDGAYDSDQKCQLRAEALYPYYNQDSYVYTATFERRCDLRRYQKIMFQGYSYIPEVWMRITKAQYTRTEDDYVTVQVEMIPDTALNMKNRLFGKSSASSTGSISGVVDQKLDVLPGKDAGTVTAVNGNEITVQNERGQTVKGRQ